MQKARQVGLDRRGVGRLYAPSFEADIDAGGTN